MMRDEELTLAMQNGDEEGVKQLLHQLSDEEVQTWLSKEVRKKELPMGTSLLQLAVLVYNVDVVRAVLSRLGSIEEQVCAIAKKNYDGETALHIALERNKVDVFHLLTDIVQDTKLFQDLKLRGHSLLMYACEQYGPLNFSIFRRICDRLGDDAALLEGFQEGFQEAYDSQDRTVVLGYALEKLNSTKMTAEENSWLEHKVEMLLNHLGDEALNFICNILKLHCAAQGQHMGILVKLLDRLGDFGAEYAISQANLDGWTALHSAAITGNLEIFNLLLGKVNEKKTALKAEATVTEWTGRQRGTVIDFAAGSTDTLRVALDQFSNSEAQTLITGKLLLRMVWKENVTGIQFLLGKLGSEKTKQAICEEGVELLFAAAERKNSTEIFEILMLALGPKQSREVISQQDSDDSTILHRVRHPSIVKLIQVAVGHPVFIKLTCMENSCGRTAFHEAAYQETSVIYKELVKCSRFDSENLKREIVQKKDITGYAPLHIAAAQGNLERLMDMVETLGTDAASCFMAKDNLGYTVLEYLTSPNLHDEWEKNLKYILEDKFGAAREQLVALLLEQTSDSGERGTLFHEVASQMSSEDQFKDFLDMCGIRRAEDVKGFLGGGPGHEQRALHVACELGNEFLVKFLLRNGCKGDILKHDELFLGNTALHAAAIGSNVDVFELLLDSLGSEAVDINQCVNWYGQTPLHFAMATKMPLVEYLIEKKGARISQPDHAGATCVHFAGRCWLTNRLLKTIDKSLFGTVTGAGMTPLHYQMWNAGCDEFDAGDSWDDNWTSSLDVVDNVEQWTPFIWGVKGKQFTSSMLYILGEKNPLHLLNMHMLFPRNGFLVKPPNANMERMCKVMLEPLSLGERRQFERKALRDPAFLNRVQEGFVPTRELVACMLVYGTSETNGHLANKLIVCYDEGSKLVELLAESKCFELAARCSSLDSERSTALSTFMKGILSCNGSSKHGDILSKLQEQLESAFREALMNNAYDSFLTVLIKHMQRSRVRELLQTRLCEVSHSVDSFKEKYKSLGAVEKSKVKDLVEDIPLAYWISLVQLKQLEESSREESLIKVEADTLALVKRMVDETSLALDSEYPNGVGRYTRRTALHWAVIFGEKDVVTKLTEELNCSRDALDDFGKRPYWYALLNKDKFKMDDQAYMNFIDLLKWKSYYDSLYKDRDVYVDGLNAILVGAALIATVAFGGLLQPPLQYPVKSSMISESTPKIDIKYVAIFKPEVQVFWVSNSMSFFLSMTSALACVTGILPNASTFDLLEVERMRQLVVRAATFLVLSILFILVAFASAGFSVLPKAMSLQANMVVTTAVGGALCVFRLVRFGRVIYSLTPNSPLHNLIQWSVNKLRNISVCWSKAQVQAGETITNEEAQPEPERRTYKRGSIHEHIVSKGGFSDGPYRWDDGLWEPPFAIMIKPESKQPVVETLGGTSASAGQPDVVAIQVDQQA